MSALGRSCSRLKEERVQGVQGTLRFSVRRAARSEIVKRNRTDVTLGHCVSHCIGSPALHSRLTLKDTHFYVLFLVLFCDI